jgi:hypothetical protein
MVVMTKQSSFPLSNEHALIVIRDMLQPDTPTLGMWFGWSQPEPNETVKLGSAYASDTLEFTWEEVFESATHDEKKAFVRLCREYKVPYRWEPIRLRGLWLADEVFFPFNSLGRGEQCLYRLHTMAVNTMTDYHNWAIEYGEYLAEMYVDNKKADVSWELYEHNDIFTQEFCDQFSHLVSFTPNVSENGHYSEGN